MNTQTDESIVSAGEGVRIMLETQSARGICVLHIHPLEGTQSFVHQKQVSGVYNLAERFEMIQIIQREPVRMNSV